MNTIFSMPVRVYYEDTDSGGVVYHSNYLNFMERARTEWLRALGFEQDELLREYGVIFAVSAVSVAFHKPARFNELLAVTVALDRRGAASLTLKQEVRRGDELLASGDVRVACIDAQRFVPVAIPTRVADTVLATCGEAPAPARRA
ncbi:MAG TPA: tol-pal system-associated acyl-CoA thioesterase [Acidiferrobacterales bacterium]|nr:tol-pal system-associated acyl-CoA thioesterase [Acidiferrobacterales bacterium]